MTNLILEVDGASRGNPGPSTIGGVIREENGDIIETFSEFIGDTTNNVAEYRALLEGIRRAQRYHPAHLAIRMDSELLVRQLNREYAVRSDHLKPLYVEATSLLSGFPGFEVVHVAREDNAEADALCNRALDLALKERRDVTGVLALSVRTHFDAAHSLRNYEGECAGLHGHTFSVEVSVEGTRLQPDETIYDFKDLKENVKIVLSRFDHAHLNEIPPFDELSPTAENLAMVVAEEVGKLVPPHIRISSVTIYESETAWVSFRPGGRPLP